MAEGEPKALSNPTSAFVIRPQDVPFSGGPMDATRALLQLVAIEKSFGGARALRGANLEARRGEIMGLCGENGAGKSTLLKVLSGVYGIGTYSGKILINGVAQRFAAPVDARRAGIAVVYQELTLVPELTVAQNLMLGREPRRWGLIDEARLEAMAGAQLRRFGLERAVDVTEPVARLGIGLRQMVEVMRALPQEARIIVLDEPTAALTSRETELLLAWLRSLRDLGTTCVYVSHRLDELFALCDRITVLRDGRTAATVVTRETTPDSVVREMVGRSVESKRSRGATPREGAPVLEVSGLCVRRATGPHARGGRPSFVVSGVSFALRRGEILAVCGAMGSGRTALLSSLFGCARAGVTGRIAVDGVSASIPSPRAAIALGIAFVPEDRKGAGLVLGMTVAENLALPELASVGAMGACARFGLVEQRAEAALAARRIEALRIRGEAAAAVSTLSGGNQQKVVLGKWLERRPKVLLLDEPTRGVDLGAREEIYGILEKLADDGVAIVLASSDLTEVLRFAQRILVLRDGRVVGEIDGAGATQEAIVELATSALPAVNGPAPTSASA
jgi:D-xylose transport system ATP-binding protein